MKTLLLLLAFSLASLSVNSAASVSPVHPESTLITKPTSSIQYFASLSIKQIEHIAGRKLSVKEKLAVKFYQWKIRKGMRAPKKIDGSEDKGKTAMIMGIIALCLLLVPYAVIASLPLAIVALIMGYKAKRRNPSDRKASTAIILGWICIGLWIAAIAIILVVLSSWSFRFE